MVEIFSYWQVNLSLAVVLFVVLYQFYRLVAKESWETSNIPIIIGFIGSLFFLLLIPFYEQTFSASWGVWLLLLGSSIFYVGNDLLKFIGFKYLDTAVVSVLAQTSKVFMIILGVIIFREKLNIHQILGVVLILSGSTLVSVKKYKMKINKYAWSVVGASLFFALAMIIDVGISSKFNLAFYMALIYFIPAGLIFFSRKKKVSDLKKELFYTKNSFKYLMLASISSAAGMMFYLIALRQGQVSIVAPLSSVTVLLNVFAGYIFLKEKDDLTKRIIAAVLVIVGIFLLV